MTEFKQIIGRGTRIHEDYGKLYFTIMDFRKATELFADPDFDGDPVQIYEPKEARRPGRHPRRAGDARRRPPKASIPATEQRTGVDPAATAPSGRRRQASAIEVRRRRRCRSTSSAERVQYYGNDGKLITESLKDYTRKAVRKELRLARRFPQAWNEADRKQAIVDELEEQGVFFDELAERGRQGLRRLRPRLPRRLRPAAAHAQGARRATSASATTSPSTASKARAVLDALLDKYADEGVDDHREHSRSSRSSRSPASARRSRSSRPSAARTPTSRPSRPRRRPLRDSLSVNEDPWPSAPPSRPSRTSCARTPASMATPSASASSSGCSS